MIAFDRRYKELRRQFLPKAFSSTGTYTDTQYTSAAAFRVLFHSELESLLEGMAAEALSLIDNTIRSGRHCMGGSAILALYKAETMGGMPSQASEFETRPFTMRMQLACIHELKRRIEANRGIKVFNLLAMFIPLGLNETMIDEQLLIDLNTLGARRGDVAHKGLRSVTALPDPKEEKVLAERILAALKGFETLIDPMRI